MRIENVAMLIPIHPPYYNYMYQLIHKLKDGNIHIDIYLIFSNMEDYNLFYFKNEIHPIILEPFDTKSIVTYKKLKSLALIKLKVNKT